MRILVYEYLSFMVLPDHPGTDSLRREGLAMLGAVLADLSLCPGVQIATLVCPALAQVLQQDLPGIEVLSGTPGQEEQRFRALARTCTHALIIAPEFDRLLELRTRWALEQGALLLGSTPEAIHLTADKLRLAEHLTRAGIRTPRTLSCVAPHPVSGGLWVIKPRFGAGSQAMFLTNNLKQLPAIQHQARAEGCSDELILQTWHRADLDASLTVLVGSAGAFALVPARQHLSDDGRFRYLGGEFPVPDAFRVALTQHALQAIASVPGLAGFVGVDLVVSDEETFVIEINPRLTTSYVGLRQLSRVNLMQALLHVHQGGVPDLAFVEQPLSFSPDGTSLARNGSS